MNNSSQSPENTPESTQPNQEYEKNLQELEIILAEKDSVQKQELIKNFISQNLERFSNKTAKEQISNAQSGFHDGFISPETKIYRNLTVDPFHLDDPEIYSNLIESIDEINTHYQDTNPEMTLRQKIPYSIQYAIAKYFGNAYPGEHDEAQNRQLYLDHSSAESPDLSINDLKGKNVAVCAEKASLAQNYLEFLGIKSELVLANHCRFGNRPQETHMYNVIQTRVGPMISDFTNPTLTTAEDGKVLNYGPAFYQITPEEYGSLKAGGQVEVTHIDKQKTENGQRDIESRRIYDGR